MGGVRNAMQLMLTGKPIRVDKALRQGFIDKISPADAWRDAARGLLTSGQPKTSAPFLDKLLNLGIVRPFIVRTLTTQVASRARKDHYPARTQ